MRLKRQTRLLLKTLLVALVLAAGWYWLRQWRPLPFDVVLAGGLVVDGTGGEPYRADVGIRNGRIAAVGRLWWARARERHSVAGMVVAPGFIDVHTHIESSFSDDTLNTVRAPNFVAQGVTTVITGNCGTSELTLRPYLGRSDKSLQVNVATLIGHNSIRKEVMGEADRDATPEELAEMAVLTDRAMRDGALGLSTGLAYVPGSFAPLRELVTLARVAARHGGLYVSHIRDEAAGGDSAISEALEVGERAGLPVHISHFKASGQGQWGKVRQRLDLVDHAIAQGRQVTLDQYPYDFSSTTMDLLLPKQLAANAALRRATQDPGGRQTVVNAILKQAKLNGWRDFAFAQISWYGRDHRLDGMSIPEICRFLNKPCANLDDQAAMVLELRLNGGGGQMLYHDMNTVDVETVFLYRDTMVGTDSRIRSAEEEGLPHPRGYSTFARILGQYVRERRLISLAEAIRRMTSLPAKTFHLRDRGSIRSGQWADLVVFDYRRIRDLDDPGNPAASPTGIVHVFVNGVPVVWRGVETLKNPGKALRRASATSPF